MKKLKNLLTEVFEDVQSVDKHSVIEGVRNYGIVGKSLYNGSNIMEVAEQLAQVAESAHHHILGENDDWFDKVSVSRNMKSLKGNVMEFQKTAKEAHAINQRLTGLYEDIGHVLNRYYDISESDDGFANYDDEGEDTSVEFEKDKKTGVETHKAPKDYWKTQAGKHEADIIGFKKTGPADMNKALQAYHKEMKEGTHASQKIESYAQLKAKKKKKLKEEAKEKKKKEKFKKKYLDK